MKNSLCIWVDVKEKLYSYDKEEGFCPFQYESEAVVRHIIRLLTNEGYRPLAKKALAGKKL